MGPGMHEHIVHEKRNCTNFLINLSNQKPGHTTGGSGRGARRSGRAGSGKIGCRQNYSPRKQRSPVPSKVSKKRCFNVPPTARSSEILCKPMEEQHQQLTTGLSTGREALFVPGCRPVERRFFSCKPFSCKACPGIVHNWTYHGRNGSGRRKAGQRGGVGPGRTVHRRIGSPRTQPTLLPPGHRRRLS